MRETSVFNSNKFNKKNKGKMFVLQVLGLMSLLTHVEDKS